MPSPPLTILITVAGGGSTGNDVAMGLLHDIISVVHCVRLRGGQVNT